MEKDDSCRAVLQMRMEENMLPNVPIEEDIEHYHPTGEAAESCGIVGGFPCQAASKLCILQSFGPPGDKSGRINGGHV